MGFSVDQNLNCVGEDEVDGKKTTGQCTHDLEGQRTCHFGLETTSSGVSISFPGKRMLIPGGQPSCTSWGFSLLNSWDQPTRPMGLVL